MAHAVLALSSAYIPVQTVRTVRRFTGRWVGKQADVMVYAVAPKGNDERRREALEATGAAVRTAGCRLAAKRNAIAENWQRSAGTSRTDTARCRSRPLR